MTPMSRVRHDVTSPASHRDLNVTRAIPPPMKKTGTGKALSATERTKLLETLKSRFEQHPTRHPGLAWSKVQAKLEANPAALASLSEMEKTGGEPDVVGDDKKSDEYSFFDCSAETPKGRRSCCYDAGAIVATSHCRRLPVDLFCRDTQWPT